MELGGKSPVLIFEDADIERAGRRPVHHLDQLWNAAPPVRYLYSAKHLPWNSLNAAERANRLRGDPNDPNTQVGALISQQHWESPGYIRLGIEEGATLLAGGPDKPSALPAHLKGGNFLRPTVLQTLITACASPGSRFSGRSPACQPPLKTKAEGLRLANDVEYGLGVVHLDSGCQQSAGGLARGIEAGMVFVNTQNVRDLRQPFGGVKARHRA